MPDLTLNDLRIGIPAPDYMPYLRDVEAEEGRAIQMLNSPATQGLDKTLREAFAFANGLLPGRSDLAARMARASAAVRILEGFSRLTAGHFFALRERERACTPAIMAMEDAAYRSVPDLAEYREALVAGRAEQAARIRAAEQSAREAADRAAPREIVDKLRTAGIPLDVDGAGRITAPAVSKVSAHDREQIVRFKNEIVAVLRADAAAAAEAAKPLILA